MLRPILPALAMLALSNAGALGAAEQRAAPIDTDIPVALLVDISSGQTLYTREADRRFMPASVTKVMTIYTLFDLLNRGKLRPDGVVEVSKKDADEWSGEGSSMFLKAGDRVTVERLLMGITTVSANDASVVMAHEAAGSMKNWIALMNSKAAELGMRNSHFGLPNGYPDEGRTFTSADDLALLASAMIERYPDLYHHYFGHHGMTYNGITQANHDPITGVVQGADGIKTGYTRQAGYNFLGSAERNGRRLVMVLAGAPSAGERNRSARNFMNWGFDTFDNRLLVPKDYDLGRALVQNGAEDSVALTTAQDIRASLPKNDRERMKLSIRYRGPLEAPIAQGQEVAQLRIEIDGQKPHDVPVVAAENVAKANILQRIINGVNGFFS
ncbi:D-alanyl-D-alanine carboxypeptidase family protein [Altericroceibacterium endophyticum]|uniref:serine-type D-Ala-D-Ala carboxypeptidase n=1 Tax=Altericroceibacterium endophyticum TaxID=1808508 RepID=A0A6I4T0Q1_9SPHN|nr:D-alanyl-D-alanine carboxypeptidase family protein [Altericroceibacterium endophyticum]MXO64517.1 serine hydrolase [Altericroceibacterium endophyticum]